MIVLAFAEPWGELSWRKTFRGVFTSIEDAMREKEVDALVIVETDGLRLVRQRMNDGRWSERDELITGQDE